MTIKLMAQKWDHDIQHNDIQHTETQNNGIICDIQQEMTLSVPVLRAVMLNVVRLSVAAPRNES